MKKVLTLSALLLVGCYDPNVPNAPTNPNPPTNPPVNNPTNPNPPANRHPADDIPPSGGIPPEIPPSGGIPTEIPPSGGSAPPEIPPSGNSSIERVPPGPAKPTGIKPRWVELADSAVALMDEGNAEQAMSDALGAIRLEPGLAQLYLWRALSDRRVGPPPDLPGIPGPGPRPELASAEWFCDVATLLVVGFATTFVLAWIITGVRVVARKLAALSEK